MNRILFTTFLIVIVKISLYSQCTTPNLPNSNSLVLNNTDTQLAIYFDTTANSPATNIYYLGILSNTNTLSNTPVNGTIYNVGDNIGGGEVIFYGKNYIYKKTGLTAGTTYYLFLFTAQTACTGQPFYSSNSLDASVTMFNGGPGIPANYYDAATGLTCTNLKTALYNIIKPTITNPAPSYTGLWGAYFITDDRLNDGANKTIVWDMYSDNPSGNECESNFGSPYQDKGTGGTVECQRYNREHSFPRAWFGGNVDPMYSDMFIVYPTDKKVNTMRGNFPFGEVSSASYTSNNGSKLGPNTFLNEYTGNAFEPIDEYKGDFARSTFYVATAYENEIAGWQSNSNAGSVLNGTSYQCFDNWYLKLLYKWHLQDPVSTKEIDRNNDVYMIQGNRNPFIDHPEYVAQVWQCTGVLPVTILSFNAQKNGETVSLNWNASYETNFKKYEIERSGDGTVFYKIGEVTGTNVTNYLFTDNNLPNLNTVYYRLKLVDVDGYYEYSKTIAIRIVNNFSNAMVYPNPTKKHLFVKLLQPLKENSSLLITDMSGRIVFRQQVANSQRNIYLDIASLATGRYFIKIINSSQLINESFIIIK
ncbi:MAG: endonuclease [Ferruginibacter sp.]|nr:endonuclease [Bacteroidota bacterium]MBX2920392.1 endonuclease [Ferruginibacter sp.]